MLTEQTLFGERNRVAIAKARLREFEPPEGYYLAFSGGKDSIVLKQLALESGVKFDIHYSVTTIDPPELVYFIRRHHPDVIWERPDKPFLIRLVEKGFPMRQRRWCCQEYKEGGGKGRFTLTGVRWAESNRRRAWQMVDTCQQHTKRFLHPIIDWSDADVWEFIRLRALPYCSLYDKGWKRIGCLFCPMSRSRHRRMEAERYPAFAKAFRRAFRKLHARGRESSRRWSDGDAMFDWWLGDNAIVEDGGLFT